MSLLRSLTACAASLAAMSASYAGPCSQEIAHVQAGIDAKLEAKAAAGPSASEGITATLHRQPNPGSIAAAESKLGNVSPDQVNAMVLAMARAREADRAGDQTGCKQALDEAQRALGQ